MSQGNVSGGTVKKGSAIYRGFLAVVLALIFLGLLGLCISDRAWGAVALLLLAGVLVLPYVLDRDMQILGVPIGRKFGVVLGMILVIWSVGQHSDAVRHQDQLNMLNRPKMLRAEYLEKKPEISLKVTEFIKGQHYELALKQLTPYVSVLDDDDREKLKAINQSIDDRQKQRRTEEFKSQKSEIIAQIEGSFKNKNYQEAINLATSYSDLGDADLNRLLERATASLEKLRKDEYDSTFKGNWQLHNEVSPIDDSQNVTISLRAEDTYLDRFHQAVTPVLHIRCKERRTETVINWGTYLGLDSTSVTYRMDKEKAQRVTWDLSSNNEATFVRSPISFIQSLLKREELYVGTTPYGENPVSVTFDIRGIKASIKPVKEACGW